MIMRRAFIVNNIEWIIELLFSRVQNEHYFQLILWLTVITYDIIECIILSIYGKKHYLLKNPFVLININLDGFH